MARKKRVLSGQAQPRARAVTSRAATSSSKRGAKKGSKKVAKKGVKKTAKRPGVVARGTKKTVARGTSATKKTAARRTSATKKTAARGTKKTAKRSARAVVLEREEKRLAAKALREAKKLAAEKEARRLAAKARREAKKLAAEKEARRLAREHKKKLAHRREQYRLKKEEQARKAEEKEAKRKARLEARRLAANAARELERNAVEAAALAQALIEQRDQRLKDFAADRTENRKALAEEITRRHPETTEVSLTRDKLFEVLKDLRDKGKRSIEGPHETRDVIKGRPGFNKLWETESENTHGIFYCLRLSIPLESGPDVEDIVYRTMKHAAKLWAMQPSDSFYGTFTLLSAEMGDGSSPMVLYEKGDTPLVQSFLGIGNSRSLVTFEDELRDRLEKLLRERNSAVIIEAITLKNYHSKVKEEGP